MELGETIKFLKTLECNASGKELFTRIFAPGERRQILIEFLTLDFTNPLRPFGCPYQTVHSYFDHNVPQNGVVPFLW